MEARKQGATAEQIAALKKMRGEQGLGAAIGSSMALTQDLSQQNAKIQQMRNEHMANKMTRYDKEEEAQWERAYQKTTGGHGRPLYAPIKNVKSIYKTIGGDAPFLFLTGVAIIAILLLVDPWRRHGMSVKPTCESTYAECFENFERLPLNSGQNLDSQQFNEMLDAIHKDLDGGWRTSFDPGRGAYDTPFWNGCARFSKCKYIDETVCLDDKCSTRSAINYVAQGMYSARTNQSLDSAKGLTQWWNRITYFHNATADELYWLEYGYNAEKERAENQP